MYYYTIAIHKLKSVEDVSTYDVDIYRSAIFGC